MEHLTDAHEPRRDSESVATPTGSHNARGLTPGLPVVVILGATATGKSGLALRLAPFFNGEIVSSDSRYLYRGMDVGTAKPSGEELGLVPHHLVDILDPEDNYSLAQFLDDAFAAIEEVGSRSRLPIVAGGTPLYLRALYEGWRVPRVPPDLAFRDAMEAVEQEELYRRVIQVDPASAERIGPANRRRLIRALEVHRGAGQAMSDLEGKDPPPYRFLRLGLRMDRETLYGRVDERVEWMFANGLLDEARALIERGVPAGSAAMSAIGYPEAFEVVRGEISLDEAIQRTRFATHRYVRHQATWFRRFKDVVWLDSASADLDSRATDLVRQFLRDQAGEIG